MNITSVQYGKYYIKPKWKGTGMCITLGDDFNVHFGIFKEGVFYKLESNFLDIKLSDNLIEIE